MKILVGLLMVFALVFGGTAIPQSVPVVEQVQVEDAAAQSQCWGNWGSTYRNWNYRYAMTTYTNVTCPTGSYVNICIVESGVGAMACNNYYVGGNRTISVTCWGTSGYGRTYWGYITDRYWNVIGTNQGAWAPVNCT